MPFVPGFQKTSDSWLYTSKMAWILPGVLHGNFQQKTDGNIMLFEQALMTL
jgi:hypothetical protein